MQSNDFPALLTLTVLAACSPGSVDIPTDDAWVGTITTEGNVTTVVTEAGSVWGGAARLVEEASIGVDVGPEKYMFGYIHGIYATDEEVFILDTQVPVLRVYDYAGRHLRDIGGPGGGPARWCVVCCCSRYRRGRENLHPWPSRDSTRMARSGCCRSRRLGFGARCLCTRLNRIAHGHRRCGCSHGEAVPAGAAAGGGNPMKSKAALAFLALVSRLPRR
jgi:hypothetical protein